MGRDERHRARTRFLYALVFSGRRCYIGQSVGARRRFAQHRQAWKEPFTAVVLAKMKGTREEAEEHEYAWRMVAHRRGWRVYAAPGMLVDPMRRATPARLALARTCTWPSGLHAPGRGVRMAWTGAVIAIATAAVAWGCLDGPLTPLVRMALATLGAWISPP